MRTVVVDYMNWKGERSKRRIQPLNLRFASTDFHPEIQWILEAVDLDKAELRDFAMKDIYSWVPDVEPKKLVMMPSGEEEL